MTLVTGSMMSADTEQARRMGTVLNYIVMGTVVFGLAYAGVFTGFGSASAGAGVVAGAVHRIISERSCP